MGWLDGWTDDVRKHLNLPWLAETNGRLPPPSAPSTARHPPSPASPTRITRRHQVSAVVRGRPSEALRVLMDPASSTTILGPAREVEVMESRPGQQVRFAGLITFHHSCSLL